MSNNGTSGVANGAASATTNTTTQWVYINGLGERDPEQVTETDVLTSISFDKTG